MTVITHNTKQINTAKQSVTPIEPPTAKPRAQQQAVCVVLLLPWWTSIPIGCGPILSSSFGPIWAFLLLLSYFFLAPVTSLAPHRLSLPLTGAIQSASGERRVSPRDYRPHCWLLKQCLWCASDSQEATVGPPSLQRQGSP